MDLGLIDLGLMDLSLIDLGLINLGEIDLGWMNHCFIDLDNLQQNHLNLFLHELVLR